MDEFVDITADHAVTFVESSGSNGYTFPVTATMTYLTDHSSEVKLTLEINIF